jgi:N-carbamoylputrescine amidase
MMVEHVSNSRSGKVDETRLTVAAVQMESRNGAVEANLERATGFAERAAAQGAKLILFPELMPTGYLFTKAIWEAAEPSDGPTARWLGETSKRLGVWTGTCFLEAAGEDFLNTFVLTGPDGTEAGRVRKQSPAAVEALFFKGVKGSHVIDTPIGRIGVGICIENQLAFMPGMMQSESVDIMLMPHSAPSPTPTLLVPGSVFERYARVLHDLPEHHARALGVPVVYANKSGVFKSPTPGLFFYEQDSSFPGESAVVDSDGRVLERLGRDEGIAVATVSLDPSRKTGTCPTCHGRWSVKVPLPINAFALAEAAGRAWYAMSRDRKEAARRIASAPR